MKKLFVFIVALLLTLNYVQAQNSGSPDVIRYALEFDGVDDYAEFPDIVLPDTFTIEMWIYPYTTESNTCFVGKHMPNGTNLFLLGYFNDSLSVLINNSHFRVLGRTVGYHHLAVVVEKVADDTSDVKLYRNGTLAGEFGLSNSIDDEIANLPLVIGMDWDNGPVATDFFNGQIDEIRLWNCSRTQQEIESNMHEQLEGSESGLMAYWKIDKAGGQILLDEVGTNYGQLGSTDSSDENDPAWCFTTYPHNLEPNMLVISDFSVNGEGWTISQAGADGPYHSATDGNPEGCITGRGVGAGQWYYNVPSKFLGNKIGVYGFFISFDLIQQTFNPPIYRKDDVVIVNDTLSLSFDIAYNPDSAYWSSFNIPFRESLVQGKGWINDSTGISATRDELQHVLSHLTEFRIRGEYRIGADQSFLDNVVLYGNEPDTVSPSFSHSVTTNTAVTSTTLTFNSEITELAVEDFEITNGTVTNLTEVTPGIEYTVEITASEEGEVTIFLPASEIKSIHYFPVEDGSGSFIYDESESGLDEISEHKLADILYDHINCRLLIESYISNTGIQIDIISVTGEIIFSDHYFADGPDMIKSMDLTGYSSGIYIVHFKTENDIIIQKILLH